MMRFIVSTVLREEIWARAAILTKGTAIHGCESGPGRSCPLDQYNNQVLARKWKESGSFEEFCKLKPGSVTTNPKTGGVTFFTDVSMPAMESIKP